MLVEDKDDTRATGTGIERFDRAEQSAVLWAQVAPKLAAVCCTLWHRLTKAEKAIASSK